MASSLRAVLLASALCLPLPALAAGPAPSAAADTVMTAHAMPNAVFTLRTGIAQGKMVYIGRGGDIDGKVNPTLTVHEGDLVQITLVNGEGAEHDIVLPELHASSQRVSGPGASSTLTFRASDIGTFAYFCSIPGHREAGMTGTVRVEAAAPKLAEQGVSIARDPSDLPPPVGERGPISVRYDL
ncbi:MAG TPA: cupredoxin domain-containing protein, partial [Acetobacteraceae bacterium]